MMNQVDDDDDNISVVWCEEDDLNSRAREKASLF